MSITGQLVQHGGEAGWELMLLQLLSMPMLSDGQGELQEQQEHHSTMSFMAVSR